MLSRDQFCQLLKIDSETLKGRARRDQLPFNLAGRTRGEYSPYEALLTLIVQSLAEHPFSMSLTNAAAIVQKIALPLMQFGLDDAIKAASALNEGVAVEEVMAKVIWRPYAPKATQHAVYIGTDAETNAAILSDGAAIVVGITLNPSRALAVLLRRAAQDGIDLSDFTAGAAL